MIFAGEKFSVQHLLNLVELLPKTDFFNLYGPTESNVCCYWEVNKAGLCFGCDIPIGHPTSYVEIKLDSQGELLVKGATIANGYVGNNSVISLVDKDGWYHTGDKCSINEAKEYIFHGRMDRMLKCYGYRIEPGEIENIAYKFAGIKECVVIGIKDGLDNMKPALFFSVENQNNSKDEFNLDQFKEFLRSNLATYMYPTKAIQLKDLPKLSNGKIDLVGIKGMLQ